MKINDIHRAGAVHSYRNQTTSQSTKGVDKKEKKDEVRISSEAKELLDAKAASAADPRGQKLEQLKQSVSSGTYHVEAGKVAEKLLPYLK
jgi:negative regulator of flagellin synthesis FlgM